MKQRLDPEMLEELDQYGLTEGDPMVVKSGKEATLYRCRGTERAGMPWVGVKYYRPRQSRGFQNDAAYREGRMFGKSREQRAVQKGSTFGRGLMFGGWIASEYATLTALYTVGLDVPKPLACSENAILMEYIGDGNAAGAPLHAVNFGRDDALSTFNRLMWNVETMLGCHRVHGDLSPYNVLYHNGKATIIDFPQAVDPRANTNAEAMLFRDIESLCRFFADFGVQADAAHLIGRFWREYQRARRYSYQ